MGKKFETTRFEEKWGERADAIAGREGVDTASIHMRIYNWANPYKRRSKPTKWERKYWKTAKELCYELNIHLQTLEQREKLHGDVYIHEKTIEAWNRLSDEEKDLQQEEKTVLYKEFALLKRHENRLQPDMKPVENQRPWLMKEHPDYIAWRSGVMFPNEVIVIKNKSSAEMLNDRQNYPEWTQNGKD